MHVESQKNAQSSYYRFLPYQYRRQFPQELTWSSLSNVPSTWLPFVSNLPDASRGHGTGPLGNMVTAGLSVKFQWLQMHCQSHWDATQTQCVASAQAFAREFRATVKPKWRRNWREPGIPSFRGKNRARAGGFMLTMQLDLRQHSDSAQPL